MAVSADSTEIFSNLSSKIGNLLFGRTEGDWNILSRTLDELNSINYRYTVVTSPTKAVLLVNQCCSFIPTDDKTLVRKCSQLLYNLVNRQKLIVEGRTLTISLQWCLSGVKIKDNDVVLDVLQALEALLRSNIENVAAHSNSITKEIYSLIYGKKESSLEILLLALQCLEACTAVPNDYKSKIRDDFSTYFDLCAKTFMHYLTKKPIAFDDVLYSKVLKVCLSGLRNVIIQNPNYLTQELGSLLGVIKTFMLYGIKGVDYITPQRLLPSTLSVPEVPNNVLREKKGGKLTKQRKHRSSGANKKQNRNTEELVFDNNTTGYTPATLSLEYNSDSGTK